MGERTVGEKLPIEMFCILRYIDYFDYKRCINKSISTLKSVHSSQYDPLDSTLYFNPNCILQLILDYIIRQIHISFESDFDLCTQEGELLGVKDYTSIVYGTTILTPRETYYIVLIKRGSDNQMEEITPILNPGTELYETLMKKLSSKNHLKRSKSSIKRRSSSKHSTTKSLRSSGSTISKSQGKVLNRKSSAGI